MSRLIRRLTLILIIPLVLLCLVVPVLGRAQSPNPALAGFTIGCKDKPQPCWYGIVPGVTDLNEMRALINSLPAVQIQFEVFRSELPNKFQGFSNTSDLVTCQLIIDAQDGIITAVTLSICAPYHLSLGDLALVPESIDANMRYYVESAFQGGSLSEDLYTRWSPYNTFSRVRLTEQVEREGRWRGFMFYWRF